MLFVNESKTKTVNKKCHLFTIVFLQVGILYLDWCASCALDCLVANVGDYRLDQLGVFGYECLFVLHVVQQLGDVALACYGSVSEGECISEDVLHLLRVYLVLVVEVKGSTKVQQGSVLANDKGVFEDVAYLSQKAIDQLSFSVVYWTFNKFRAMDIYYGVSTHGLCCFLFPPFLLFADLYAHPGVHS